MHKNNVRFWRLMQGLSMEKLSNKVGCSRENIWRIERGDRYPSVKLALLIARELGAKVEHLWSEEE